MSRPTVYTHFPEDAHLFEACQADYLASRPMPNFDQALSHPVAAEATRTTLRALDANYRARAPMLANVLKDREALPALDTLVRKTFDDQLARLAASLRARLRSGGEDPRDAQARIALALDFGTWRLITSHGLSDEDAVELMTELIVNGTDVRSRDPRSAKDN